MKNLIFLAGIALVMLASCKATSTMTTTPKTITSDDDKVFYSLGSSVAEYYKSQGLDSLDYEAFMMGVRDVFEGDSLKVSDQDSRKLLNSFFTALKEKQATAMKAEGEAFLAENAKKEGVVSLPSGLQYKVLKMGDGPKPGPTDKVKTHYHGTLIDGTVFDSSVQRGEPISFPVNGVIRGWTEALQLMPVGSKWVLYIPYNLAYGERGAGQQIAPYSALVFEVELLDIEK